jgi:hypothetical protein
MLCYAMLCYAMLWCYAMRRHAMHAMNILCVGVGMVCVNTWKNEKKTENEKYTSDTEQTAIFWIRVF